MNNIMDRTDILTNKPNGMLSKNNKNIYDVIIIGAGASGLFAAASPELLDGNKSARVKSMDKSRRSANTYFQSKDITSNRFQSKDSTSNRFQSKDSTSNRFQSEDTASNNVCSNFRGLILEKTSRIGTKLLMSGSGQCNITHDGSIKDFIDCYGNNGKKIRSCLYKYSNLALMEFLEQRGVPTFAREDGKVFPKSMDAHDILNALIQAAKANGFEIKCNNQVTGLKQIECALHPTSTSSTLAGDLTRNYPLQATTDDKISRNYLWQVTSEDRCYYGKNIVIASGGCSYPSSGSDGTFFEVLRSDLSIDITPLKPSLAPIQVEEYPYCELSGISFDNVKTAIFANKKIAEAVGGLLFTHRDLSGPAALNISKYVEQGNTLTINYLHPMNYADVLERLKKSTQGSASSIENILATEFSLPKRFCQLLVARYGNSLKRLAAMLTGESFVISATSGFNKAMATSGGIALNQLNLSTFEFRKISKAYAIGEAVDIDGVTGGYNLQFAFSSARAAMASIINSSNFNR